VYLAMGWSALFCYFELAKSYSHSTLLPLPLGGVFYSVGAILNLLHWPVLLPGVFGAHELFHFFVIAGSACHIFFMAKVVAPSSPPAPLTEDVSLPQPVFEPTRESAWERRTRWLPHFSAPGRRVKIMRSTHARIGAGDDLDAMPHDNAVGAA
jgi:hypothetical protein